MTRADLIEEVSRVVEMPPQESHVIVEAIFGSTVRSLRGADNIEIRGFGSFHARAPVARGAESEDRRARGSSSQKDPLFQTQQRAKGSGERRRETG
jgi:hypothetical protein